VKRAALITLIFGLATLGVFVAFRFLPEVQGATMLGDLPSFVSSFQRAETLADLAVLFGVPPDAASLAAMNALNTLDLYAFIPSFTIFLIAGVFMLAGAPNGPLPWAAIVFVLIGAGADVIETSRQLGLGRDFSNAEAYLPIAPWHWLKYGALGLNGLAVAGLCFLRGPRRYVLGFAALLPLPAVLAAWAGLAEPRVFAIALTLYWVALLVAAGFSLVRAKGASA